MSDMAKKTRSTLHWDFPIPRTHCGVALGNGNFGMLVWGRERLHLTVNRADFWDHRNGEVVPAGTTYADVTRALGTRDEREGFCWMFNDEAHPPSQIKSSRLPMGRFEVEFAEGLVPRRAILQLKSGRLTIELSDQAGGVRQLSLAMAIRDNVVALEDPTSAIRAIHVRTAWEWVEEPFRKRGLAPAEPVREPGLVGWIQSLPDDPSMAALCRQTAGGYLIALSRGRDNPAARAAGLESLAPYETRGMAGLFKSASSWWRQYWKEVPLVHLPSDFFNRFLDYALYKFGCATTPESPIPAGLQGPWAEEYQMTPWNGDYHFNVNVQQIYTLAFAANRPRHLLPLFNMLESEPFYSVMRQTAKRLFGIDDGLVITHAVDDRGRQVGGLSIGSIVDQACGGWTAQLYWLYYRHTGDVEFLRTRAYPFMHGIMRAFEGMLVKRDGKYRMPVGISAEYHYVDAKGWWINYGPDPSYQFACIHMLLDALFESDRILGLPSRAEWKDIKEHLPPYTLIDGTEGPEIAVWGGQNLDDCHRHHSHLACIYPFDSLGEMTPEQRAVVENSIDHWIATGMGQWSEWCIPWAAIIQARMGFTESPRILLEMWKDIYINEGLTTVYLPRFRGITAHRRQDMLKPKETHEVMQLDGTMGGAAALYEMLVHSHQGVIHVFRGISEQWRDVAFKNIALPGPARVSAERRDGRTMRIDLESTRGGTFRLAAADLPEADLVRTGTTERVTLPVSIELRPGETITLKRIPS